MKHPKIIFFTAGIVPNKTEAKAIAAIPFPVAVRNASCIGPNDGCEPCAGVLGEVPDQYDDFPSGNGVIKAYVQKMQERDEAMKALDSPAPDPEVASNAEMSNGTGETPPTATPRPAEWVSGN